MGTETSWTTKDWPTPSPTVKPTSKFNLFTFWSQHRTTIHLFCCYFSASFLFLFSLSCSICCICRPFYYYFNYRQKKKPNIRSSRFFFELNNSIKQQQRSVCLSQQQ